MSTDGKTIMTYYYYFYHHHHHHYQMGLSVNRIPPYMMLCIGLSWCYILKINAFSGCTPLTLKDHMKFFDVGYVILYDAKNDPMTMTIFPMISPLFYSFPTQIYHAILVSSSTPGYGQLQGQSPAARTWRHPEIAANWMRTVHGSIKNTDVMGWFHGNLYGLYAG